MKEYKLIFITIILLSGCLISETKPNKKTTNKNNITTTTFKFYEETTIPTTTIQHIETIVKLKFRYVNTTLNLSYLQAHEILNMKPKDCHTVGCSFGFSLAKKETISILELDGTKFSERPRTGGYDLIYGMENTDPVIPIKNDGINDYVILPKENWYISYQNNSIFKIRRK